MATKKKKRAASLEAKAVQKKRAVMFGRLEAITDDELKMLRAHPYERPKPVHNAWEERIAQGLIDRGLLERDPTAAGMLVRCTEDGMRLAKPLSIEEVALVGANIGAEEPRIASDLRRALWRRVLTEVAAESNDRVNRIASWALRTERRRGR